MSYHSALQSNNTELEEILQAVNELPERGALENAVLYTEQDLSKEEKAQARKNIGLENWTLVSSVVTEEAVSQIVLPMGEHKITSDEQKMLIYMVVPPNDEATADGAIRIIFGADANATYLNSVAIFAPQSVNYGRTPYKYKSFHVYTVEFLGNKPYTNRYMNNANASAFPYTAYTTVGNIYDEEFGTNIWDNLCIFVSQSDYCIPAGTEVTVYVK